VRLRPPERPVRLRAIARRIRRSRNQNSGREAGERRAFLQAILEELARPLGHGRGLGFAERHFRGDGGSAIHAQRAEHEAAVIHDGNRDRPFVLGSFGFAGGKHLFDVDCSQAMFRTHGSSRYEAAIIVHPRV
jgi:hypothetical protein